MEPHEPLLQTGCTRPERNVARPFAVGCTFGATASAPGLAAIELVGLKMPCDRVLWSNDPHQSCAGASTIGAAMPTQKGVASTPTSACTWARSILPGQPHVPRAVQVPPDNRFAHHPVVLAQSRRGGLTRLQRTEDGSRRKHARMHRVVDPLE